MTKQDFYPYYILLNKSPIFNKKITPLNTYKKMEFIRSLPPVVVAVNYGSSFLRKANKTIDKSSQIDLILAVDDFKSWT